MNTPTKTIDISIEQIALGDIIHSIQESPGGPGVKATYKRVNGAGGSVLTIGSLAYRTTKVNEVVSLQGGGEKRFPLGTIYRVERALTPEEIAERKVRFAEDAAQEVQRRVTNATGLARQGPGRVHRVAHDDIRERPRGSDPLAGPEARRRAGVRGPLELRRPVRRASGPRGRG